MTEHVKCLENGCFGLFSLLFAPSHSFSWLDLICLDLTDAESDWHLTGTLPGQLKSVCVCVCVLVFVLMSDCIHAKEGKRSVKCDRLWQRSSKRLIWKCSPYPEPPGTSSSQGYSRDSSVIGNVNVAPQWSVCMFGSRRLEQNAIKVIPAGAFSPYKKLRRMWVDEGMVSLPVCGLCWPLRFTFCVSNALTDSVSRSLPLRLLFPFSLALLSTETWVTTRYQS